MADIAKSLVFDAQRNTLFINGQEFEFAFTELEPVFRDFPGGPRSVTVPGVRLVIFGADLDVVSALSADPVQADG